MRGTGPPEPTLLGSAGMCWLPRAHYHSHSRPHFCPDPYPDLYPNFRDRDQQQPELPRWFGRHLRRLLMKFLGSLMRELGFRNPLNVRKIFEGQGGKRNITNTKSQGQNKTNHKRPTPSSMPIIIMIPIVIYRS